MKDENPLILARLPDGTAVWAKQMSRSMAKYLADVLNWLESNDGYRA